MLLAIDIGNTSISLGLFKGGRLLKKGSIPTAKKQYWRHLKAFLNRQAGLPKQAVLCSVVPKSELKLVGEIKKHLGIAPLIIGKDFKVPIQNCYRKPKEVGQDRLVNAYAAKEYYGEPLVALDFGTAITFDVVCKKGRYIGGLITPGLNISLEALAQRTALLPKIKLNKPKEFIGGDTKNSMLSGIIYGFAALTDGLILRIKEKAGKNAKIIATGGYLGLISRYCRKIDACDSNLTLKGLCLLYKKYKKIS